MNGVRRLLKRLRGVVIAAQSSAVNPPDRELGWHARLDVDPIEGMYVLDVWPMAWGSASQLPEPRVYYYVDHVRHWAVENDAAVNYVTVEGGVLRFLLLFGWAPGGVACEVRLHPEALSPGRREEVFGRRKWLQGAIVFPRAWRDLQYHSQVLRRELLLYLEAKDCEREPHLLARLVLLDAETQWERLSAEGSARPPATGSEGEPA